MLFFKLSLRLWKLFFWRNLGVAFTMALILCLIAIVRQLHQDLRPWVQRSYQQQRVTAYLNSTVSEDQEQEVFKQVQRTLAVTQDQIRSVGPQEFLSDLKDFYPDLVQELKALGDEGRALIPRYLTFTGLFDPSMLEQLKNISGIEALDSVPMRERMMSQGFMGCLWALRVLGMMLFVLLVFFLIQRTRRVSDLQKDTFGLLRLSGAQESCLMLPILLEGSLLGCVAGLFAILGWWFSYRFGTVLVRFFFFKELGPFSLKSAYQLGWIAFFMAIASSGLSQGMSTVRYLRLRKKM